MKVVLAKSAVDMLRNDSRGAEQGPPTEEALPQKVARECVRLLAERVQGTGGLILLDRQGRPGFAFNTPRMAFGYVATDGTFVVCA